MGPERIIFVGGAPRSGTTLTHALICSGQGVSGYHPEVSFYRHIAQCYREGLGSWAVHTHAFFSDPAEFRRFARKLSDAAIHRIWAALGRPRILCMKDPHLTPLFPELGQIYGAEARFVTVARHPVDVVRSRQEVHERMHGPESFTEAHVQAVASEYLNYYGAALNGQYDSGHFSFCYEEIEEGRIQGALAAFLGLPGFDPASMWGDQAPQDQESAWHSPKYGAAIDTRSRLEPLRADWAELTIQICAPVMNEYGYRRR